MWRLLVDQQRRLLVRLGHPVGESTAERKDEEQLGHQTKLGSPGKEKVELLGRVQRRRSLGRFELRGLGFDQPHNMFDHVGVLDMVIGHA